jgi:hypothetical protein
MGSVFGGSTDKPTVIKAGKAIVTVGGTTLLALGVQVQFGRNVELVPALSKKRVVSLGEPQGQFTANTILAKGIDAFKAFKLSGDDCKPFDMKIKFDANDGCDMAGKTVTAKNCFASNVTVDAQGGRGYVAEGVQVTFTALELD